MSWPAAPMIGPRGQLNYRDRTVYLSERNAMLAGVLVYYFESAVTGVELLDRVWPEGATRRTLRHRLGRLDRRLGRLGLKIVEAGDGTYTLCPVGLGGDGAADGSADEQYPHVGSVHESVGDRSEY